MLVATLVNDALCFALRFQSGHLLYATKFLFLLVNIYFGTNKWVKILKTRTSVKKFQGPCVSSGF